MDAQRNIARVLLLAALAAPAGCAGSARTPASTVAEAGTRARTTGELPTSGSIPAEGVDTVRAYLPMEKIEPAVASPARPTDLKPLPARAAEQIAIADKLAGEQRYTEASLELEKALRFAPNHPDIQRALANLHLASGSIERARAHALKALEGNPDDAKLHVLIGSIDAQSGDDAQALTALRTALRCSDIGTDRATEARCRFELSLVLARLGYVQAALDQRKAVEAMPPAVLAEAKIDAALKSGEARLFAPTLLEKLGRHAEAADALKAVVAANPGDDALAIRYARALLRAGRTDEALAVARGVKSRPADVVELLTEIHKAAGHPERIVEDLLARLPQASEPADVLVLVDALLAQGRTVEARQALETRLSAGSESPELRARLIEVYIAAGAWQEAIGSIAAAVAQRPERADELTARLGPLAKDAAAVDRAVTNVPDSETEAGLYVRGALALQAGRTEQAVALFERSLARRAGFVPARAALGRAYLRAFRYDDALRIAKRTNPDEAEDAGLELVLGLAYDALDKPEEAEQHLRAAIQLDRNATEARFTLAQTYLVLGRRNQAVQQLRLLLEAAPGHERACEVLAGTYLAERKVDEARKLYEELAKAAPTPMVAARARAMVEQFTTPNPDVYRKSLRDAMQAGQPDAAMWIALAESYHDFDAQPIRDAYGEAVKLGPASERAMLGLIRAEQGLLHFDEAARLWKQLLPRRPNRHVWRLDAGGVIDTHLAFEDFDGALSVAREGEATPSLEPETKTIYRRAIIRTLLEGKRVDDAVAQLKAWAAAAPDEWLWQRALAGVYVEHDRPADALPILEMLREQRPTDESITELLLETLVDAGQAERAQQYALGRMNDDPDNDEHMGLLLTVLVQSKRYDDAIELVRNKVVRSSNRAAYQDMLATLLASAGRRDEAIELIESLINEESRRGEEGRLLPALQDRLIELLINGKEFEEAQRLLAFWLSEARDVATQMRWLVPLAVCQDALGDAAGSARTKEQALSLNPDNVTLNNDLAYSWISMGERLSEAETRIRFAVSRAPRQAAYLDTYGWLLYKKGAFEEARTWLGRALRAPSGEDPVIADHLGDACWRLGRKEEAVGHWRQAAELVKKITDRPLNADEKRVTDEAPRKIEEAAAGREPLE